jgi:DNA-binding response OmpR family regulator
VFDVEIDYAITECERLRAAGVDVPVVALITPPLQAEAVAAALDAGIDSCVSNSVMIASLVAQLEQLARRDHAIVAWADLTLDVRTRIAMCRGHRLNLTSQEFTALETLMRHPRSVASRALLEERIWGKRAPSINALEVVMGRVRRKLHDAQSSSIVVARRREGYLVTSGEQ